MPVLVKSLLAIAAVLSLSACVTGGRVCPPGSHLGPFGHRCVDNRR